MKALITLLTLFTIFNSNAASWAEITELIENEISLEREIEYGINESTQYFLWPDNGCEIRIGKLKTLTNRFDTYDPETNYEEEIMYKVNLHRWGKFSAMMPSSNDTYTFMNIFSNSNKPLATSTNMTTDRFSTHGLLRIRYEVHQRNTAIKLGRMLQEKARKCQGK